MTTRKQAMALAAALAAAATLGAAAGGAVRRPHGARGGYANAIAAIGRASTLRAGYPDAPAAGLVPSHAAARASDAGPVYLVYFWRARAGKGAEYSAYIRDVAEPIDENARRAGVFEEVHTYTPFLTTGAPGTDWTHMRVFRLKNFAALDAFSAGMDAATARVHPGEAERKANSARSAELRDLVRQEIWRDFH